MAKRLATDDLEEVCMRWLRQFAPLALTSTPRGASHLALAGCDGRDSASSQAAAHRRRGARVATPQGFKGPLVLRPLTRCTPQPRPEYGAAATGADSYPLRNGPGAQLARVGPVLPTALKSPRCAAAAAAAFADAAPRQPYGVDALAAPRVGSDFSSPSATAPWKFRSVESSQRTPESPTRCALPPAPRACGVLTALLVRAHRPPLASDDSEGPESTSQYADVNQLLRALHFERLLRLQSRSPQPPPPVGAQQARNDALQ